MMIAGRGGGGFRISNFEFRIYRRGEATMDVGACCPRLGGGGEEEFGVRNSELSARGGDYGCWGVFPAVVRWGWRRIRNSEFGIVGAGRRLRVLGRFSRGCAVEVKKISNFEFRISNLSARGGDYGCWGVLPAVVRWGWADAELELGVPRIGRPRVGGARVGGAGMYRTQYSELLSAGGATDS